MTKNIQIRIGLVGLGHVTEYQLEALLQLPAFKIVGVCDTNPQKAQIKGNIPFFTNIRDFLKSVETDIVLVSTPVNSHFEVAKIVLESGRNVLIEKPATSNLNEFNELVEISHRNNTLLTVAFHAAFAKDLLWFLKSRKRPLYERLGPITGFRCTFYDPYIENGILLPRANSLNGSWIDGGINALSVIGQIVDIDSLRIEEAVSTRLPQYNYEIQSTVHFVFSPENSLKTGRGSIDTN
jgi:predicted dehydrogenase